MPTHKQPVTLRAERNFWASFTITHQQTSSVFLSKQSFILQESEEAKLQELFKEISTREHVKKINHPVSNTLIALLEKLPTANIKISFKQPGRVSLFIRFSKHHQKDRQHLPAVTLFEIFSAQKQPPQYIVNMLESICVRTPPKYIIPGLLSATAATTLGLFTFFCRSKKAQNRFDFAYHHPRTHCSQIASELGKRMAFYKNIPEENCFFTDLVNIISPVPGFAPLAWIQASQIPEIPATAQFCVFNAPFTESIEKLSTMDFSTHPVLTEIIIVAPSSGVTEKYITALKALQENSGKTIYFFALETSGSDDALEKHASVVSLCAAPKTNLRVFWFTAQTRYYYEHSGALKISFILNSSEIIQDHPAGREKQYNPNALNEQNALVELLAQESSLSLLSKPDFDTLCTQTLQKLGTPANANILIYDEKSKYLWFSQTQTKPISFAVLFSQSEEKWEAQELETFIEIDGTKIPITDQFDYTIAHSENAFENSDPFLFVKPQSTFHRAITKAASNFSPKTQQLNITSFINYAEVFGPVIAAQKDIKLADCFIKALVRKNSTLDAFVLPLEPETNLRIPENCKFICVQAPHSQAVNWLFAQQIPKTLQSYVLFAEETQITAGFIRKCKRFSERMALAAPGACFTLVAYKQQDKTIASPQTKRRSLLRFTGVPGMVDGIRKNRKQAAFISLLNKMVNSPTASARWVSLSIKLDAKFVVSKNAFCSWKKDVFDSSYYYSNDDFKYFSHTFFAPEFNGTVIENCIKKKFPELAKPNRPAFWRKKGLVDLNILIYDFNSGTFYVQYPDKKVSHALFYGTPPADKTNNVVWLYHQMTKGPEFIGPSKGIFKYHGKTYKPCLFSSCAASPGLLKIDNCNSSPDSWLNYLESELQKINNNIMTISHQANNKSFARTHQANNPSFDKRSRSMRSNEVLGWLTWRLYPRKNKFDFWHHDSGERPTQITNENKHWFATPHDLQNIDDFFVIAREIMNADTGALQPTATSQKSSSNNKLFLIELSHEATSIFEEKLQRCLRDEPDLGAYLQSVLLSNVYVFYKEKHPEDFVRNFMKLHQHKDHLALYSTDAENVKRCGFSPLKDHLPATDYKMPTHHMVDDKLYIKPILKSENYICSSPASQSLQRNIKNFNEIHYFRIPHELPDPRVLKRPTSSAAQAPSTPQASTRSRRSQPKTTSPLITTPLEFSGCRLNINSSYYTQTLNIIKQILKNKTTSSPKMRFIFIIILSNKDFKKMNFFLKDLSSWLWGKKLSYPIECFITGNLEEIKSNDLEEDEVGLPIFTGLSDDPIPLTVTLETIYQHGIRSSFFDFTNPRFTHESIKYTNNQDVWDCYHTTFNPAGWVAGKPNLAEKVLEWSDSTKYTPIFLEVIN